MGELAVGSGMGIRVYIVEDHPVIRETLVEFLDLTADMAVCGMAATAEDAATELEAAAPTVVLVDLSLPGRSGLDLLAEIKARWQLPTIVLSGHGERSYVGKALSAGARGYVLKGRPAEVPLAIRRVLGGELYLSEVLWRMLERDGVDSGA